MYQSHLNSSQLMINIWLVPLACRLAEGGGNNDRSFNFISISVLCRRMVPHGTALQTCPDWIESSLRVLGKCMNQQKSKKQRTENPAIHRWFTMIYLVKILIFIANCEKNTTGSNRRVIPTATEILTCHWHRCAPLHRPKNMCHTSSGRSKDKLGLREC